MRYFFTLILFSTVLCLFGQQKVDIYKQNNDTIFLIDFVSQIEKEYKYQFFYKKEWVDSLVVKQSKNPSNIKEILKETFQNTELSYFVYDENKIIITNNYQIVNILPTSLFSDEKNADPIISEASFLKNTTKKTTKNHKNGSITIGNPAKKYIGKTAVISGVLTEEETGYPIIGAVVYVENKNNATTTGIDGKYTISIPKGKHTLLIRSVGKKEKKISIIAHEGGKLDIKMEENVTMLSDIIINAEKGKNVDRVEQGLEVISMKALKKLPTIMGEADIIKSALLLPGIQTSGEGNSGFNVRGGNSDQNLILIDDSPIFNSSHLFGFFSALNPDIINDFKLYKSSFPANYGGRLSSIVDISIKNGDMKKYHLVGGISPITGRLAIDGPIIKDRVSFLVAGRSTYSDWILRKIESPVLRTSSASFNDLNAKLTVIASKKDNITTNAYLSNDNFKFNSDTIYSYSNRNANLAWKHTFSPFFQTKLTAIYSNYNYNIESDTSQNYNFLYHYDLEQLEGKLDFIYTFKANHKIKFGVNSIQYNLNPGKRSKITETSVIPPKELRDEKGRESALYINDEFDVTDKISFNIGLRYSYYQALGSTLTYEYDPNSPKTVESKIDSTFYNNNEVAATYGNPELRLAVRYKLGNKNSLKASYSNMTQYIHMLSNTYAISPTDAWTLSNAHIEPQKSTQYSIGYYQNFKNDAIETSIETYYKDMKNLLEYKPGASLFLNQEIETDLLSGLGYSYGVELMIKKKKGKLNGWVSYTFSRSLVKVDGEHKDERINNGDYYPTNYDKPHDLTIVANYIYSRRITLSGVVVYNTGRPITYPESKYIFADRELLHYSDRNEYRVPNYFRIDLSLTIEGNLRLNKLAHSSWTFSVYNLTGRNNVYSIYFESTPENYVKGYKMSVFAQPVPTITYNFRF